MLFYFNYAAAIVEAAVTVPAVADVTFSQLESFVSEEILF